MKICQDCNHNVIQESWFLFFKGSLQSLLKGSLVKINYLLDICLTHSVLKFTSMRKYIKYIQQLQLLDFFHVYPSTIPLNSNGYVYWLITHCLFFSVWWSNSGCMSLFWAKTNLGHSPSATEGSWRNNLNKKKKNRRAKLNLLLASSLSEVGKVPLKSYWHLNTLITKHSRPSRNYFLWLVLLCPNKVGFWLKNNFISLFIKKCLPNMLNNPQFFTFYFQGASRDGPLQWLHIT